MSSYVIEHQSRGIGAIASRDLGQTAKTSGALSVSSGQALEARYAPATQALRRDTTRVYATATTPFAPVSAPTGSTLSARDYRGAPASAFVVGETGIPIAQTPRLVEFARNRRDYPFLSRPGYDTVEMGIMSGRPPATLVRHDDFLEDEALVPNFFKDNTPWWILGGLAALWMLTRK